MGIVVLLTGPPAAGKTTLSESLSEHVSPLQVVDYGGLLLETIEEEDFGYESMRKKSASVLSYEVIRKTDKKLIKNISIEREETHIVIDSHPITKEEYGYRCAHYDKDDLDSLNLDMIIALH